MTAPPATPGHALPPWSRIHARRRALEARWPTVFHLPLVRRASDVVLATVRPGDRVLEVGAGDRRLGPRIAAAAPGALYRSADPDPAHPHDWPSADLAAGPFDVVVSLELVEHLPPEDGLALLRRAHALLAPGGRIVLSTPDVFTPGRWHRDAGHRTPFSPWELGAFVEEAGFAEVDLRRAWNGSLLERIARRGLLGWLHRFLGVDYAASVVVTARRPDVPPR